MNLSENQIVFWQRKKIGSQLTNRGNELYPSSGKSLLKMRKKLYNYKKKRNDSNNVNKGS